MSKPHHHPDAATFVNHQDINQYFAILFGGVAGGYVNLRGIGEKGTAQEGKFREDVFTSNNQDDTVANFASNHAARWAQWSVATFVVPAVMKDEKGTADNVEKMTCMILDLDTDCDTDEARDWLTQHVGEPTMVIRSGGINGAGSPKRHFYWRLSDSYTEIQRIVELRHVLAMRAGGDMQFGVGVNGNAIGRAHQPIRIPGTVHSKHGVINVVAMDNYDEDVTYSLRDLEVKIKGMPAAPWLGEKGRALVERHKAGASMSDLFSASSGKEMGNGEALLNTKVTSGGGLDRPSRYDAFSAVAGHFLRLHRKGELTQDEAFDALKGWTLANMDPVWPDVKIQAEWRALLTRELKARGPVVARSKNISLFSPDSAPDAVVPHHEEPEAELPEAWDDIEVMGTGHTPLIETTVENPLLKWAAHRWVSENPIEMPFLVDGLICMGEQHMMAAEGGAGKSYSMIDLGMRVAAKGGHPELELEWFGQEIIRGGTVVLILNEDSMNTLNNRIIMLDQGGMKDKAGDRFIPLPMSSLGGAFTLADKEGEMSSRWAEYYAALKMIPDLALVIMDTFSTMLHGSEVDPVIVNQMMKQANQLTGETGAAMLWLHHVRKPGEEPIRGVEDMKNAVRGSTAIIGSMRHVIGMWRPGDWERKCKALNLPPDRDTIWRCAIVKSNLDVPTLKEKTLARSNGRMLDLSEADPYNKGNNDLRGSWLVVAVKEAAKSGYPFSKGGKNDQSGLYKRRGTLPDELNRLGHQEASSLIDWCIQKRLIVACAAKGSASPKWLDVPQGDFASTSGGAQIAKGAWTPPDWAQWLYDSGQGVCVKSGGGAASFADAINARADGDDD